MSAVLGLAAELTKLGTPDMGFLLYAAGRVLDGARLYRDVVEINPPLIIGINLPIVKLARATGVSEFMLYRIGSALSVGALVVYAGRLIHRYVFPQDPRRARYLLILFCFALLTLVRNDLGQREHFVLALLTPYLLLVAGEINGRRPPSWEAAIIGTLAGLAVGLKPSFMLVWAVLEAARRAPCVPAERWRVTPEASATVVSVVVYGVVIWRVTPDYLGLVALLGPAYVGYMRESFVNLVLGPGAPLVAFVALAFLALRRRMQSRHLGALLAYTTVACFAGGAAQGKNFHYHYYPALGLAFVLLGLIAAEVGEPQTIGERVYARVSRALLLTIVTVVVGWAIMDAAGGGPGRAKQRAEFRALASEARVEAGGRPIGVLSHTISSAFPLVNYAGVESASRFPSLWLLAAIYWDPIVTGSALQYHTTGEMDPVERYFLNATRQDLLKAQPRLLIVLRPARDAPINGQRRLDYVRYLARDPQLAALLAEYRLTGRHGEYLFYERGEGTVGDSASPLAYGPGTQDLVRLDLTQVRIGQFDRESVVGLAVFVGWWLLIGVVPPWRARP